MLSIGELLVGVNNVVAVPYDINIENIYLDKDDIQLKIVLKFIHKNSHTESYITNPTKVSDGTKGSLLFTLPADMRIGDYTVQVVYLNTDSVNITNINTVEGSDFDLSQYDMSEFTNIVDLITYIKYDIIEDHLVENTSSYQQDIDSSKDDDGNVQEGLIVSKKAWLWYKINQFLDSDDGADTKSIVEKWMPVYIKLHKFNGDKTTKIDDVITYGINNFNNVKAKSIYNISTVTKQTSTT